MSGLVFTKKKQLLFICVVGLLFLSGCATVSSKELSHSDNQEIQKYFKYIKERIYRFAYKNYDTSSGEGEVLVYFTLLPDGEAKRIRFDKIKSNASKKLANVVRMAIKGASPFPPFSDELKKYPKLNFQVVVSFEVEKEKSK